MSSPKGMVTLSLLPLHPVTANISSAALPEQHPRSEVLFYTHPCLRGGPSCTVMGTTASSTRAGGSKQAVIVEGVSAFGAHPPPCPARVRAVLCGCGMDYATLQTSGAAGDRLVEEPGEV